MKIHSLKNRIGDWTKAGGIRSAVLAAFLAPVASPAQYSQAFLESPRIVLDPASSAEYTVEKRTSSGVPSLAVSPGGRIWVIWFTGVSPGKKVEDCPHNYVVLATSGDGGESWQEVLVIDPDGWGPVRAFDPQVWTDPNGRLWIFWTQEIKDQREVTTRTGKCYGVWAMILGHPDEPAMELSDPARLTDGVMINKPVVLSGGEWVLPASTWMYADNSARMVVSTDEGKTWNVRSGVNVPVEARHHDEHHILERKDGSLWMLVRTRYGIGESISWDRGYSWSPLKPAGIEHPSARFFITRLHSGNLLMVKHGPIGLRTRRSHLMAFVSSDDGTSWSKGLLLDQRQGVTYPDGQQVRNGTVYLTYDYGRSKDQMILMLNFAEEDVLSGSDSGMVRIHQRRRIVSQGGINRQNQ